MITNVAEAKFVDVVPVGEGAISYTTPLLLSLTNGILQGGAGDASSRVGNRIFIKGIWFAMKIMPVNATSGGPGNAEMNLPSLCRIMVVRNTEGAAGLPNINEILTFNGAGNGVASPCTSFRNSQYFKKYQILSDRLHSMMPSAYSPNQDFALSGPLGAITFYVPIGKQFNFRGSTAVAGNYPYNGMIIPATWTSTANVLNDDYQILIMTDEQTHLCCRMTLSWKVIFSDF